MKDKAKHKLGDSEVRILRDGRVVFVAPDEELLSVADSIAQEDADLERPKKGEENDRDG
jgi:hypothetical protein